MTTTKRVLVAGIGNIFFGDDGFGPAVIRRLPVPRDGVRVTDYGLHAMHLAYDLLDDWDGLILVDALPALDAPGRMRVLRATPGPSTATRRDTHTIDPDTVFAAARTLGATTPPTVLVGCQITSLAEGIGLSAPVAAALPHAVTAVTAVLAELTARQSA